VLLKELVQTLRVDPLVQVRPLSVLTIENLEDVLAHLSDLSLPDVLDEYATAENIPLSTFDAIFRAYLRRHGIDQQRHGWSVKKGEAFLNSILLHFNEPLQG